MAATVGNGPGVPSKTMVYRVQIYFWFTSRNRSLFPHQLIAL
jgi:hypothetical protein